MLGEKKMKDKNRKGFFGLFQHAKRTVENLEENVAPHSEPDDSSQSEESEVNDNNTTPTSNMPPDSEQADESGEKESSSLAEIWELSDDPLILRVNEELLEIERRQFAMKMKTLSNIYKKNAEAVVKTIEENKDGTTKETTDKPDPKEAQPQIFISRNSMAAWIYVIPPMNGGSDISEDTLRSALTQDRIKTGILEETVKSIVKASKVKCGVI